MNPVDGAIAGGMLKGMAEYRFPGGPGARLRGRRREHRRGGSSASCRTGRAGRGRGQLGGADRRQRRGSHPSRRRSRWPRRARRRWRESPRCCASRRWTRGGERVLIAGATGGVGAFVVQSCAEAGATVDRGRRGERPRLLDGARRARRSPSVAPRPGRRRDHRPRVLLARPIGDQGEPSGRPVARRGRSTTMAISDPAAQIRLAHGGSTGSRGSVPIREGSTSTRSAPRSPHSGRAQARQAVGRSTNLGGEFAPAGQWRAAGARIAWRARAAVAVGPIEAPARRRRDGRPRPARAGREAQPARGGRAALVLGDRAGARGPLGRRADGRGARRCWAATT